MKTAPFVFGLCVGAFGVVGIVAPGCLISLAQHAVTPAVFYCGAVVRVALGLLLISVAAASRAPKALRVLGYVIVIAGIATALTGLVAIDQARAIIESWWQHGAGIVRLTGVAVMALGSFIAWACAPARHAV